jgi:hypothetical protein
MRIIIESIPHSQQRYDTYGDWQFIGDELIIKVSEFPFPEQKIDQNTITYLIGLHEMIEAILCQKDGVTEQQVDEWDKSHPELEEPGEDSRAPYFIQHQIASGFERGLCKFLGLSWEEYEKLLEGIK